MKWQAGGRGDEGDGLCLIPAARYARRLTLAAGAIAAMRPKPHGHGACIHAPLRFTWNHGGV